MRYILAGALALGGVLLLGLAIHDHVADAWKVVSA